MTCDRYGDWMQTSTGRAVWPLDPRADELDIVDIAHALSNLCRYGGHCREFYSVAQHSVLVSRALPDEHKLWGLLHDASEAYLVDIPRPVKRFMPDYERAENRMLRRVATRFGLSEKIPDEVKRVDNAILVDEMRQLMSKPPAPWKLPEPALGIEIKPWSPKVARTRFLAEFLKLTS